ncbi:cucumber peeling cupredoxin-like [Hibiscus syriacus]|uniref:cucumber peeling cupredoxin-like n=1 Tax=Hibiscus syriacus TaxID=106335 RepID=UPI001921352F|nr:cucumber peeling cupredoxin-like [Hibiscus syriacus]
MASSRRAQTAHVVGDDMGWTVPQNGGTAYSNWAATWRHLGVQLHNECSDDNPFGNMLTNGPANVTLNSTGQQYYICTLGRHCELGQILAITGLATSGSPSPPPSPTTPTTPSTTSGTPADCTPAPTSGPTAGLMPPSSVPGPNGAPNSSSSSAVLVNLLVSTLDIAMSLIF